MSSNTSQATSSNATPDATPARAPQNPPSPEEGAPSPEEHGTKASAEEGAAEAMKEIVAEGKLALLRAGKAIKKPAAGAAIAGTATIAAAVLWGAAEAAVGVGAALVVYRILRKRKLSQLEYKQAA